MARLLALLDEADGTEPLEVAVFGTLLVSNVNEGTNEVVIFEGVGMDDEVTGGDTGLVKLGVGIGGRDVDNVPTVIVESTVWECKVKEDGIGWVDVASGKG